MRKTIAVAILLTLVMVGCSGSSGDMPSALVCEDDQAAIIDVLRSGIPTYDYDPVTSLQELIDGSDLIVVGTVDTLDRVEHAGEGWTVISASDSEVLKGISLSSAPGAKVPYPTSWPDGAGADPLAEAVAIEGLSFMAFLVEADSAPGGYTPMIQGLVVACDRTETLVTPVIADLPIVPPGATIDELTTLVS